MRLRAVCSFSPTLPIFLGQPPLDVHVDVFVGDAEGELSAFDLFLDGPQSGDDLAGVGRGDNALLAQHAGMGHAAGDVVPVQAPVHIRRTR